MVVILGVWQLALLGVTACSETTRYRVLSFLFDGVPDPEAVPPPPGYPALGPGGQLISDLPSGSGERTVVRKPSFPHAPYRDNECNACHNLMSGLLARTPQEGLCQACHPDTPGDTVFLHGPVAVADCFSCHLPHAAFYPKLLTHEPTELCFQCHPSEDLTTGPHHETVPGQACLECHDAHGGSDRFFLKRSEP